MNKYTTLSSVLKLARSGTVIFADAEYLHGSLSSRIRPSQNMWKYSVQIGAVKYSNGVPVDTFSSLIHPPSSLSSPSASKNILSSPSFLSSPDQATIEVGLDEDAWNFFTTLTALKREDIVANGKDFLEVWGQFTKFIDSNPVVICLGDKEVYKWTHTLHAALNKNGEKKEEVEKGLKEIEEIEWIRLKPMLQGKEETKDKDSGQLYEVVGMSKEEVCPGLSLHDALFDACSMGVFCTRYEDN